MVIRKRQLILFLAVWISLLYRYEIFVPQQTFDKCRWRGGARDTDPTHRTLLIADPQIVDEYSYPSRPRVVQWVTRMLSDRYARRNYAGAVAKLSPNTVFFLGDLFDGGREWSDDQWYKEYARFNNIFPRTPFQKVHMGIPGNHDIGFGNGVTLEKFRRFEAFFGEANDYFIYGNHSFITLDTVSLSSENATVRNASRIFLDTIAEPTHVVHQYPKILLSHVPLYRLPDKQTCGPLRESKKPFPIMKGNQYQTVIDFELTQEILSKLTPKIAFTGDDHDYCHIDHWHEKEGTSVKTEEVTVKSFSMNGGISKPALQMVGLYADEELGKQSFETHMCVMPPPLTPIFVYISFIILHIVSLVAVFKLPHIAKQLQMKMCSSFHQHPSLPVYKWKPKARGKVMRFFLSDWAANSDFSSADLFVNVIFSLTAALWLAYRMS